MQPLTEGMQGMIDYVSPLVDERIVNPGNDFISVLAQGESWGLHAPSGPGEHLLACCWQATKPPSTSYAMAPWPSSVIQNNGHG